MSYIYVFIYTAYNFDYLPKKIKKLIFQKTVPMRLVKSENILKNEAFVKNVLMKAKALTTKKCFKKC